MERSVKNNRRGSSVFAIQGASCLFVSVWLIGCFGPSPYSTVSPMTRHKYPPRTGPVGLFFDTDIPDVPFEQVASIEVIGGKKSSNTELFNELREKARSLGCHAVIYLREDYMIREDQNGLFEFADLLAGFGDDASEAEDRHRKRLERQEDSKFEVTVWKGIAVRYSEETDQIPRVECEKNTRASL